MSNQMKDYRGIKKGNWQVIDTTLEKDNSSNQIIVVEKINGADKGVIKLVRASSFMRGQVPMTYHDKKKALFNKKKFKTNTTGYRNVIQSYKGRYKGMFRGQLNVQGKVYRTSWYKTAEEASKQVKLMRRNWVEKDILPNPQLAKTKTGHKYISFVQTKAGTNEYHFQKRVGTKLVVNRYFRTLTDALTYRNQWLTDHNLPIPD